MKPNQMQGIVYVATLWMALFSLPIAFAGAEERKGRLLMASAPAYPVYCSRKGLQGYVDFVFTVDANGTVKNAKVLDVAVFRNSAHLLIDDSKAKKSFVSSAKVALKNYRYQAPVKNGRRVDASGVTTRIRFVM